MSDILSLVLFPTVAIAAAYFGLWLLDGHISPGEKRMFLAICLSWWVAMVAARWWGL